MTNTQLGYWLAATLFGLSCALAPDYPEWARWLLSTFAFIAGFIILWNLHNG